MTHRIDTWDELVAREGELLHHLDQTDGAAAFLTSPLAWLEHAGYELSDDVKARLARCTPTDRARPAREPGRPYALNLTLVSLGLATLGGA